MPAHTFSADYLERHFSNDERWLRASGVPGVEAASYRVLNHAWSKDRTRVYLKGRPLRRADPESFTVLNELYARDASQLFCSEGRIDLRLDPGSFEVLDEGWCEGWSHVRYVGYARDAEHVYFGSRPSPVRDADPASFQVLTHLYARDRKHVFHEGKLLEHADPYMFRVLTELYTKDGERVFYAGRLIEGADPASFSLLDEFLSLDARHVYDRGRLIQGADPLSFERIEGTSLAVDRAHVFVHGQVQPHIDRASFAHLGHDYFADRSGVYWCAKRVKGAHRRSFVVEGYSQARDRSRHYSEEKPRKTWHLPTPVMLLLLPLRIPWIVAKSILHLIRNTPDASARPRLPEAKREADMRTLACVLANGDEEASAPVLLAIDNMAEFRRTYAQRPSYADEPNYEELLEQLDDPDELHAFDVLEAVYRFYDLFGVIDWRSQTEETVEQIEPMLRRLGVVDFDWSFVEVVLRHGDGSELRNNNLLSLLQDQLDPIGLALVHVNLLGDSYGFAVVPQSAYAQIAGFAIEGKFEISRDFQPDEAYDRGKAIVQRHYRGSGKSA